MIYWPNLDRRSVARQRLKEIAIAAALTAAFFAVANNAHAAPGHNHKAHHHHIVPRDANGNVVGGRPPGCPHAFCGCSASLYLFGVIKPKLNLAANWLRFFPRAEPAPMMAAARRHHVMVLIRHVEGSVWVVHDGNSGGHLTRVHQRSIAGYTIVNPHAERFASVN